MKKAGVIGLGDMGSGLARNLIEKGFSVSGLDLSQERMEAFSKMGGQTAASVREVAQNAEAVFVMVMTGEQAAAVIHGEGGLVHHMAPGGAVILSATIKPQQARQIGIELRGSGIHLIDLSLIHI